MSGLKLFYGSTSGNTEGVARLIEAALGSVLHSVTNIALARPEDLEDADALILGISTWDMGAPQEDWAAFLPRLDTIDLSGKRVALFGLGDAKGFSGMFVNGLRILYDHVAARGATVVGRWPTDGYTYEVCEAVVEGTFVGLVIDQENQSTLTHQRVVQWVRQIQGELQPHQRQDGELLGESNPPPSSGPDIRA